MATIIGSQFWDATKKTIEFAGKGLLQPLSTIGISGYFLDVIKTQSVKGKLNITDYYTENGFAINDVASREPLRITITGVVAEKALSSAQIKKYIQIAPKAVAIVQTFLPSYTAGVEDLMKGKNSKLVNSFGGGSSNIANATTNLFSQVVVSIPKPTKQGVAFNYFEAIRNSAILLSIQIDKVTYLTNMALEEFEFTQPEGHDDHSIVELQFKQIRGVGTQVGSFTDNNVARGSTGSQSQKQVKKYLQGLKPSNVSAVQKAISNPK